MKHKTFLALGALGLTALGIWPAQAENNHRGWPAYGGGPKQLQYSALDQITPENVGELEVAWTFTADGDPSRGTMHSTPLLAGGRLFVAGPDGGLHALDPGTGARVWHYDPNATYLNTYFRGAPRALMYWQDGDEARLFGVSGSHIFAVNAKNGALIKSFGKDGRIDLRENLGRDPATQDAELGSPGVIYKDLMIVGSRMGEGMPTSPGHVRAYDVRTGEMRWIFHTIPHPGEYGYETWPKEAWKYSGAANSWSGMSLDEERGLVIFGTGSAASDFYGADRAGDNLFANSVVALDAATGERRWHQQLTRHDLWDRDIPAPPSLVTLTIGGKRVDAVVQTTKTGHIWIFDRDTGEPLFPIEEIEAAPGGLPGEAPAKSQRLPLVPKPVVRQVFSEETITRRTKAAYMAVKKQYEALEPHHPFRPPSTKGQVIFPGYDGGLEWGGGAFDPDTGHFYVNANEMPWILKMVKNPPQGEKTTASGLYARYCSSCHGADRAGTGDFPSLLGVDARHDRNSIAGLIIGGAGRMPGFSTVLDGNTARAIAEYLLTGEDAEIRLPKGAPTPYDNTYRNEGWPRFLDPDGYPAVTPPWGTLTAINLNTGEHLWQRPFGTYPELVEQGMTETGSENYGGPVVTAGGLIFIGATIRDRQFHAFDKKAGDLLWTYTLPASGVATPAVYEHEGRQYVVIAAGGPRSGGPRGATYFAFALPAE